ncbi:hypothetical protein A2125_02330 [Candidatus Woesebacteria bacterium GWB1_43_5]|uniref:Uncharacterized protein n=1 Tax=Candidatus Woesebacteria bacterium GWB1_43_5 TaxID=1802474 RepID=A0A1F7WTM8_9BACT|nr:MAG: hypothetical protein A2125_02330 [Candidatus Woesebacteria bacterium GWB1_43_5]
MKYFLIATGLVTVLILIGGIFFVSKNQASEFSAPTTYEYFWGDGCPHCAKVAEFFDSWDGDEKLKVDKKEVWNNPANTSLMTQRARTCNITPTEMGVPLLVTPEGKCVGGDEPIINFLKGLEL